MEVILREHVDNLGRRGEIVKVANGYARNYLLPRNLALPVTEGNRRHIERERAKFDAREDEERKVAEAMAARLAGLEVVIARKVGETEALYGSVTSGDIAEALAAKGFDLDKRKIQLLEPLKKIADVDVPVKLHRDVTATVKYGSSPKAEGRMANTAIAERTLPHNLDAERSVLGAILLHNDAFNLAAEVIDAGDFFRDAHRRIFDKMVKLAERGDAIDLVTLKEELGRAGEIDEVGGPAYIAALVDGVPRSTNVEHYARIIKEKATLRNLIFSANKILATAYDAEEDADIILDQAEHAIFAIADDKIRDGFVSMRVLAQGSLETIEKLHARKELVTGVPTGFTDLDEMTSGLQAGDLVIIAARPSMGKTSLALNVAQHVGTKTGRSVGIFSLEMAKEQLFLRMLTAEARIDAHRMRGGFLGERDWGRLSQAIGTLSEAKIFIDDSPSIGVLEMRAKCRRLKSEHGLHLVIVDYIQLMQGRGRFENRTLEVASISRSMKGLAKELGVPIVVLSQLSRAPESRSDHRPQLSDLRESGALEQDADVVMFIYREDLYVDKSAPPTDAHGVAEVIVGKQRNGPTGVVKLAFIREFTRFENLAPGHQ